MKASIKFRDEQKPLMRAKIPLNILNVPFQSGVCFGESKELTLNLATFFDSGPSLKFAYRPNESKNPFSFIFKTGIGNFGSPAKSPLTMSAEFNLIGTQNPSFFIHFKPDFGDFSLKKSHSSEFTNLGDKLNGNGLVNVENGYFKGNGFFPASPESKAAAGQVVSGLLSGTTLSAKTCLPLRDFANVNFRWGLRVPNEDARTDIDAVLVGKKGDRNGFGGIKLPLLVMNKIGIEHVSKVGTTKEEKARLDVGEVCMEMRKKLDVIQAENGMLSKALGDLRADIAAGKMDVFVDHRSKYGGGGGVDKKSGFGGKHVVVEGNKESSGVQ